MKSLVMVAAASVLICASLLLVAGVQTASASPFKCSNGVDIHQVVKDYFRSGYKTGKQIAADLGTTESAVDKCFRECHEKYLHALSVYRRPGGEFPDFRKARESLGLTSKEVKWCNPR